LCHKNSTDLAGLFCRIKPVQNRIMIDAIILHRADPAKNMRRFYRLDVQPDLFGAWCVIREWGRIGRAGQVRTVRYATAAEAHEALTAQRLPKERRGYASAQ
jgi:predicted DNA-binding WGR domain protein